MQKVVIKNSFSFLPNRQPGADHILVNPAPRVNTPFHEVPDGAKERKLRSPDLVFPGLKPQLLRTNVIIGSGSGGKCSTFLFGVYEVLNVF